MATGQNHTTALHQFASLPKELRLKIWRYCLPRRVVELDYKPLCHHDAPGYSNQAMGISGLTRPSFVKSAALPPKISQVCHEACGVAHKRGKRFIHAIKQLRPVEDDDQMSLPAWVDTSTDTLYFNGNWGAIESPNRQYLKNLAETGQMPVVVRQETIELKHLDYELKSGFLAFRDWSFPDNCCKVNMSSDWLTFHITKKEAIESGLWGLFGEEQLVMVKRDDQKMVRKYLDLYYKRYFPGRLAVQPPMYQAQRITWRFDDERANSRFERIRRGFKVGFLWAHGCFDKDHSNFAHELQPGWYKANYNPNRPVPLIPPYNESHPIIKEVLAKMPRIEFMILFRLCTEDHSAIAKDAANLRAVNSALEKFSMV